MARTHGTWEAHNSGLADVVYAKDGSGADRRIAEMIGPDSADNARLVAASPELLGACESVLRYFDEEELPWHPILDVINAAIAKATD